MRRRRNPEPVVVLVLGGLAVGAAWWLWRGRRDDRMTAAFGPALADYERRHPGRRIDPLSFEERMFSNGCLDAPGPDEMCTQAMVPGYVSVFEAANCRVTYHVSRDGDARLVRERCGGPPRE